MKLALKLTAIGTVLVVLTSCNGFNELLKSDDYAKKVEEADVYYKEGVAGKIKHRKKPKRIEKKGLIRKEKYKVTKLNRSIALYEQVYQQSPKSAEGELAYFRIGKAYYYIGDYYMAGYYLGMFPQRFPFSAKGEESLFLSAMCSVNNSPAHSLDQTDTELAIRDLQSFIDRYPQSNLIDSCNNLIDGLRFKLEKKQYEAVLLYDKTESYLAAVTSAETFVEDYPLSSFREDVLRIAFHNSYLYAINSVDNKKAERIAETTERYNTFVAQFPESEFLKEMQREQAELEEAKEKLNNQNKN